MSNPRPHPTTFPWHLQRSVARRGDRGDGSGTSLVVGRLSTCTPSTTSSATSRKRPRSSAPTRSSAPGARPARQVRPMQIGKTETCRSGSRIGGSGRRATVTSPICTALSRGPDRRGGRRSSPTPPAWCSSSVVCWATAGPRRGRPRRGRARKRVQGDGQLLLRDQELARRQPVLDLFQSHAGRRVVRHDGGDCGAAPPVARTRAEPPARVPASRQDGEIKGLRARGGSRSALPGGAERSSERRSRLPLKAAAACARRFRWT